MALVDLIKSATIPSNHVGAAAATRAFTVELTTDDSVDRALAMCLAAAANLARVSARVGPAGHLLAAIAAVSSPSRGRVRASTSTGHPAPVAVLPGPSASALTPRQREVAILIAQGLTNRQIADQLVISERTVDTHVQNILGKLELATRTQVAAWLIDGLLRAAEAAR